MSEENILAIHTRVKYFRLDDGFVITRYKSYDCIPIYSYLGRDFDCSTGTEKKVSIICQNQCFIFQVTGVSVTAIWASRCPVCLSGAHIH